MTRPQPSVTDMIRRLEQLPPCAPEAELSVLGCILLEPAVLAEVTELISAGDFHCPKNAAIYEAMLEQWETMATVDSVALIQVLGDRGQLSAVGGVDRIRELADAVPSADRAVHYARLVRDKAVIRRQVEHAARTINDALGHADDPAGVLERADQGQQLLGLAYDTVTTEATGEAAAEAVIRVMESDEDPGVVPTGHRDLDLQLGGGLYRGQFVIAAGRPSMGKTAAAITIALSNALQGRPVLLVSLEMSRSEIARRLLSAVTGIQYWRLTRSMTPAWEMGRLREAAAKLRTITIDDTAAMTPARLRARARRWAMRQEPGSGLLIVDYLQLLTTGKRAENRQTEVAEISRSMKTLARELEVPVLALSQLNRAPEVREGHRPRLGDLRESGALEQDSDVVLLLHREAHYRQDDREWLDRNRDTRNIANVIIAKQRNGPTCTVDLVWDASTMRFHDVARQSDDPELEVPATPSQSQRGIEWASVAVGEELPI